MANQRKMPLVYEIMLKRFVERSKASNRVTPLLSVREITNIFSVVYHIPKDFHYAIIKEFEEFGVFLLKRENVHLVKKEFKK